MPFIRLKKSPSLSSLLRNFLTNGCWIILNISSALVDMGMGFSFFTLLMWWITLIFECWNSLAFPSKAHLVLVILFMHCWMWFIHILLKIFALCSWGTVCLVFFFVLFLCGAGIKIMLALYNNMFPPLLYSGGECIILEKFGRILQWNHLSLELSFWVFKVTDFIFLRVISTLLISSLYHFHPFACFGFILHFFFQFFEVGAQVVALRLFFFSRVSI